jgi:hypothetical protein
MGLTHQGLTGAEVATLPQGTLQAERQAMGLSTRFGERQQDAVADF